MSLNLCPKCGKRGMHWSSPDDGPLTEWRCTCGFFGLEDEKRQTTCTKCGQEQGAIWFVEGSTGYFWCTDCGVRYEAHG